MPSNPPPPNRATFDAMAAFLTGALFETLDALPGEPTRAVAETAQRFNDTRWFWTDDNAKAAEVLCEPATFDRDPAAANAALDFVLRMTDGLVMQRRAGPPELRVIRTDPADVRIETAFFIVEADLTSGVFRHALRFNDARTVTAAETGGFRLHARHNGRSVQVPLGSTVIRHAVDVHETHVDLRFTSALRAADNGPVLGEVEGRATVAADSPAMDLSLAVRAAPGVTLDDVEVVTCAGALAAVRNVNYRAVRTIGGDGRQAVERRMRPWPTTLHAGSARYASIVQEGHSPGFNYGLHLLLPDGGRLAGIRGRGRSGRLHDVTLHYAMGRVTSQEPAVVKEARMLTGGGFYDVPHHYEAVLQDRTIGGHADPSMSYDIGAEMNAVATHLLFAKAGRYRASPSPERLQLLQAWYDRHAARLFEFIRPEAKDAASRVFTRGLAFVVLSLDGMVRATGEDRYRDWLGAAVDLTLQLARPAPVEQGWGAVAFGDRWSPLGRFVDCHAACLLALSRASWHGDPDGQIARAVHAGWKSVRPFRGTVRLSPTERVPYDGLAIRNRRGIDRHVDTTFWTFKLGLLLRALHASTRAAQAGRLSTDPQQAARIKDLSRRAEALVGPRLRGDEDRLEALTSPLANETNSETQPWVALGYVPVVDEALETIWLGRVPPPHP